MKAVVHDRYGPPDVLRLDDVPKPEPKEGRDPRQDPCDLRQRVPMLTSGPGRRSSGASSRACSRPKRRILGHELAGEIEAVGTEVTEFEVGDRVFGALPYLALRTGAHAEYIAVPANWPLARIPQGMTYEQTAAVSDGALCALNGMRPVGELAGKRILVYGASGSIGTAAVQLANHFGAHVTAVCNTKNVELVRSLGAEEVIDYLQDDFTQNGKTYDVIFDAVGKHSFRRCKSSLVPGGYYLPTDGFRNVFLWLLHKKLGEKKVVFEFPRFRKDDVVLLGTLMETGEYRPVVDRVYPLEEVVEATRYVETQQKTGNVVLAVVPDGEATASASGR